MYQQVDTYFLERRLKDLKELSVCVKTAAEQDAADGFMDTSTLEKVRTTVNMLETIAERWSVLKLKMEWASAEEISWAVHDQQKEREAQNEKPV